MKFSIFCGVVALIATALGFGRAAGVWALASIAAYFALKSNFDG